MLAPPGSSNARQKTSRQTKAEIASPDDVIRQLQRVPANKKCADCSSKLPSCVNLTIGTFICMTCAGVHRESNARIKSVGHSSFTAEEAEQLKATDNDQINALYMARYSPSTERLRRPIDNRDLKLVRAWISRKYKDRAWYGGGNNNEQQPQQQRMPAQQQRQQRPPTEPQPTVVQIPAATHPPPPQRKTPSRQAAVDLFADFDASSNQKQSQPQQQQQQQWDAFGSSATATPEQPPFEANFASFPSPTSAQSEAFPADFGSSQARRQQGQPSDPFQQVVARQTQTMADPFAQQPVQQQSYGQSQFQQPQQASSPGGQPFGQFGQLNPSQQFSQPQPQQQGPNGMMMNHSFGQPNFVGAPQSVVNQQQPSFGANSGQAFQQQSNMGAISQQQNQPFEMSQSHQSMQSSVNVASATDVISAMNFHLEKPVNEHEESSKPETKAPGKYSEGQRVYYKSSSYSGEAEIVKVHLDDELKPYYTIKVNGKEKQTDESHLGTDPVVHSGESALLRQVTDVLSTLSNEQLQNVLNFAKGLAAETPNASFPDSSIPNQADSAPASLNPNAAVASQNYGTHHGLQTGQQQPVHQTAAPPNAFSFSNQTQSGPSSDDAFAGIPSPSSMNKPAVQLNGGSLPTPNVFQSPSGMPFSESITSSQQGSFRPQFQQQPMPQIQNLPQMQMPSNGSFPNQGYMQQQLPQGQDIHTFAQHQPPFNGIQTQQPPPVQMEAPPSPKGNPFDFH